MKKRKIEDYEEMELNQVVESDVDFIQDQAVNKKESLDRTKSKKVSFQKTKSFSNDTDLFDLGDDDIANLETDLNKMKKNDRLNADNEVKDSDFDDETSDESILDELSDEKTKLAEMNEFLDFQDKLEEKRTLGKFDGAEKLISLIERFEVENLQPRGWELQGEVSAADRKKDELLDQYIDVDFRAKAVPIISTETTENLESMIVKRIKDKAFDDVVRKFRQHESLIPQYRNKTSFEDTIKKGLAEVYEEEFQEKQIETIEEPELDLAVQEIQKDMNILFKKLDALSHYQFTPSTIESEVKIVKNVASLKAEEIGPMASVEFSSTLLAPEEIVKHIKALPKAKDELNVTDKKRLLRNKKMKQKVLAKKGFMTKKEGKTDEIVSRFKEKTKIIKSKKRKVNC